MEIIDAQIGKPQLPTPWEHGEPSEAALACELLREAMDSVGVDAALIQGGAEFCGAAYQRYPDRFGGALVMKGADLLSGDIAVLVSGLRSRPGMLAIRTLIRSWKDEKLYPEFANGTYNQLFAAAEANDVPVFVAASGYLPLLHSIAEAYPKLAIILDHCGLKQQPNIVSDDPWDELPDVIAMARFPNVALKFSGVITLSRQPYPYPDIWPHVHKMANAFGPGRMMWGSDFTRLRFAPRTDRRGPRKDWYGLYSDSVNFLRDTREFSQADKEQIFSGTIRRLLRWAGK